MKAKVYDTCGTCDGTGMQYDQQGQETVPCFHCAGEGHIEKGFVDLKRIVELIKKLCKKKEVE